MLHAQPNSALEAVRKAEVHTEKKRESALRGLLMNCTSLVSLKSRSRGLNEAALVLDLCSDRCHVLACFEPGLDMSSSTLVHWAHTHTHTNAFSDLLLICN